MDSSDYRAFADSFVRYETRTRTVDNGDGTTSEEEYTVAVPLTSLPEIYGNDGTVLFVLYENTGYGYHLAIDHGGGFVTIYAHCSKILVTEGQTVKAGDIIAQVGSTGRSTGKHLHFEIRVNGEKQNPRDYLP